MYLFEGLILCKIQNQAVWNNTFTDLYYTIKVEEVHRTLMLWSNLFYIIFDYISFNFVGF